MDRANWNKRKQQAKMKADIDAFLAAGGTIKKCDVSDNKGVIFQGYNEINRQEKARKRTLAKYSPHNK